MTTTNKSALDSYKFYFEDVKMELKFTTRDMVRIYRHLAYGKFRKLLEKIPYVKKTNEFIGI